LSKTKTITPYKVPTRDVSERLHTLSDEEEEEWDWEEEEECECEEEEEDLPICFGDYGRYIDCGFCPFAHACFAVKEMEEHAMIDALDLLED
jgi:hypothetical protein